MKIDLGKNELIHFVGIGGIGMSGLALIMNGLGYKVQGSDIANNKNIERLNDKKVKIFLNHKRENIKKTTVLVISSAIKKSNPEIQEAIKKKLPIAIADIFERANSVFICLALLIPPNVINGIF